MCEDKMARYDLRTFCKGSQLEIYESRSSSKLRELLGHPRFHKAGYTGKYDAPERNADAFEIRDSHREIIFQGDVDEAMLFLKRLR
jgi:hypothetical protein